MKSVEKTNTTEAEIVQITTIESDEAQLTLLGVRTKEDRDLEFQITPEDMEQLGDVSLHDTITIVTSSTFTINHKSPLQVI